MYAYDEEQRIFHSIDKSNSKNYCPIVFYKFNGHFYLINDRSVISSTAETNKTVGTKIISITIEDKKIEENLPVYQIEKYDVSQSKNMIEGIYIVNQSNLDDEVIEFMKLFIETPLTKSKRSHTIQLKLCRVCPC